MTIKRLTEDEWKVLATMNSTKAQLAEKVLGEGVRHCDFASPQPWLQDAARKLAEAADHMDRHQAYEYLRVRTVWYYPEGQVFGHAIFLTQECHDLMVKTVLHPSTPMGEQ
jgi:hypothetical protein